MRYLVTITLIIVYACLTRGSVSAQTTDERLWGVWDLDSIELTINSVTQRYTLPVLLANRSILPRNMLTQLYFFKDQIGVNSTETEFVSAENVSLKGSFTANDGKLNVTMRDGNARTFNYSIENEFLKIRYSESPIEFYLIYRLTAKLVD